MGCVCGIAAWIIKYLLFIENVLFLLTGVSIITMGAIAYSNFVDYELVLKNDFSGTALAVIVIGCVIFCVSFCGCCGAIKESRCLLLTYACFLLVILISQVSVGIWAVATPTSKDVLTREEMKAIFNSEYQDKKSEFFDKLQSDLECCGVDSPLDFVSIFPPFGVPSSCCPENSPCSSSVYAYKTGCYVKLTDYVDIAIENIGIVSMSLGVIEVCAMLFAVCLANHVKSKHQKPLSG